jgi:hypothetical protein
MYTYIHHVMCVVHIHECTLQVEVYLLGTWYKSTNASDLRFEVIVNFVIEVHVCGACVHVCHNY